MVVSFDERNPLAHCNSITHESYCMAYTPSARMNQ